MRPSRHPAIPPLAKLCLLGLLLVSPLTARAAAPALLLVSADHSQTVDFSIDDLAAMPLVTVATENEFSDGMVSYRGPLVRDVLVKAGMERASSVRFTAVNDYFVDIPTDDFRHYDAILAIEANGERLSRRDKGPIWLMYPISSHPELQDPIYLRRLIWQVVRIEAQ